MNKSLWGMGGIACLALVSAAAMPNVARADYVTLTDHNSVVNFDTTSQNGMENWYVDGVDHMYQQAFWYRVGNEGGEHGISELTQTGIFASDSNPFDDTGLDTLAVRYQGAGFRIDVKYSLQGGSVGSHLSDVGEQIKITNTGERPLDFHFFQYNDYDLGWSSYDSSVAITGGNTATQRDEGYTVGETVVTPAPNQYAVGYYANQLNDLIDGSTTNLGTVAGPLTNGDLTWAFQWDVMLGVGSSFQISKDKNIAVAPVPGAALLGMMGLSAVGFIRRKLA